MNKTLKGLLCGTLALSATVALSASTFATDVVAPETTAEQTTESSTEIAPTFATELDESNRTVTFRLGHNLILTGNNLNSDVANKTGFVLAAGNNLSLRNASEYGVLLGNSINYAGATTRDLYIAGNSVTLAHDAKIGRDVFAAANVFSLNTDVDGNVAVTADTVTLKDVKIAGNLNLDVAHLEFAGKVEIAGALVYNDNAEVVGLDQVKSGSVEAYHVEQDNEAVIWANRIYGELFSAAALFLAVAILCAFYPRLHEKLSAESTAGKFGTDLALGLGALIAAPIVAICAFFTLIAAPLGIIVLALYLVGIYLAQGFAGAWLGHMIVEKLFKAKGNIFAEAALGIILLSLLSLVPYLGVITGFIALLLGLGLILKCLKPAKATTKKGAKA